MTTFSAQYVMGEERSWQPACFMRYRRGLMVGAWVSGLTGALLWYWPMLVCNVLPGLTCNQWLNELLYLQMHDFWCSRLLWAVGVTLSLGASLLSGPSMRWPDVATLGLIHNGTHLGLIMLGPGV